LLLSFQIKYVIASSLAAVYISTLIGDDKLPSGNILEAFTPITPEIIGKQKLYTGDVAIAVPVPNDKPERSPGV
jgi:hypothetical protein